MSIPHKYELHYIYILYPLFREWDGEAKTLLAVKLLKYRRILKDIDPDE